MLFKRIALIGGLTLAFMAPSVQAAEPNISEIQKQNNPTLTWRDTMIPVITGIASGGVYGAFIKNGMYLGAFCAALVKGAVKEIVSEKPSESDNAREDYKNSLRQDKKSGLEFNAAALTTLGIVLVSAATGNIVVPSLTQELGKFAPLAALMLSSIALM